MVPLNLVLLMDVRFLSSGRVLFLMALVIVRVDLVLILLMADKFDLVLVLLLVGDLVVTVLNVLCGVVRVSEAKSRCFGCGLGVGVGTGWVIWIAVLLWVIVSAVCPGSFVYYLMFLTDGRLFLFPVGMGLVMEADPVSVDCAVVVVVLP